MAPLIVYPSISESYGFVAVTQISNSEERPVAFLSRPLSITERKWGEFEQLVSVVSWGLRKLKRYTMFSPKITIQVEHDEEALLVLDRDAHMRLRALLIDLTLYRCQWKAGVNQWKFGAEVLRRPE